MEGIAALSLACNIVQIIGYGSKAVQIITQVYQDGQTSENVTIENTTKSLRDLCREVELQIKSTTLDKQFLQITQETINVAAELLHELSKLKGNGSAWSKLKTGFVAVKRKGRVEKLRQRLSDQERAINTSMLATLREQNEATRIIQEKSFGDLDSGLQSFIVRLSQGQVKTADHITAENENTRALVLQTNQTISSQIDTLETSKRRTQLLKSLRYPEMNARLNRIEEASRGTFDSFFEPSSHYALSKWFQQGRGVFWIQGKAGSGKSTLMKYILQSPNLTNLVSKEQPKPLVLYHFFWLSGSLPQRDFHGLLCSLAYQLMNVDDRVEHGDKIHPDDWSVKELEGVVSSSLRHLSTTNSVLILLDALDEYDEQCDRRKLLNLIFEISEHARICVSSRPELFWVKHLRWDGYVKLEDTTKTAIEIFVNQKLEESGFTGSYELASTLTKRAEGVFLWAHLAVRDVVRGLDSNATEDEIQQRIERLPKGMEGLYTDMLRRLGEDWSIVQQEAAVFFSTVLLLHQVRGLTDVGPDGTSFLYQHNVAMKTVLRQDPGNDGFESLERECVALKDRIAFTCAGMLEVTRPRAEYDRNESPIPVFLSQVGFTHRTVRDFLLDVPFGRQLTQLDSWVPASVICGMIRMEYTLYQFKERELDWLAIGEMLVAVISIQSSLNLDGEDLLKMILAVKQLLVASFPTESASSSQPVEFTHCKQFFSGRSRAFYYSTDFLGLTLECGTICYFNSLSLKLESMTLHYIEYLLFCTVAPITSSLRRYSEGSVYWGIWKILREYGASGTLTFWLTDNPIGRKRLVQSMTANKLFLSVIFSCIYHGWEWPDVSGWGQVLNESSLDVKDTYSFYINTASGQIEAHGLSSAPHYNLYVEANLKYWLSTIYPTTGRFHWEKFLDQATNYQTAAPFRRLRYVALGHFDEGVPIYMNDRLIAANEDGEALLQLWEASQRRCLRRSRLFQESDQKLMDHEAVRLLRSVQSHLRQVDPAVSLGLNAAVDVTGNFISLVDYLFSEGVLRDESEASIQIPVFKQP